MTDKPVFMEIESPVQFSELSPGMYAVNCKGKFNIELTQNLMQCAAHSASPDFFSSAFLGVLLPYYLHNANNLMVGVLGNLDLAGMFLPNLEKVEPKIAGARSATGSVVDFLRGIASAIPGDGFSSFNNDAMGKCLTLLRSACGRSVDSTGLNGIDISSPLITENPDHAVAAFSGMAAWTVVSLGGSGTVSGSSSQGRIGLKWTRPEGAGLTYMPGSENSASILATAGGLAAAAGMALVIENWTENEGEVSLVG